MIHNEAVSHEEKTELVRSAIEHRATWFYMLLDEARKRGLNMEELGRAAIYRCGCFHGALKHDACENPADVRAFDQVFADETGRKVFEMETLESGPDKLSIDFHYCPLVNAWLKAGASEEDLPVLCDIAMDGDRGIVSKFDGYSFRLDGVIAKGDPVCRIRIEKK